MGLECLQLALAGLAGVRAGRRRVHVLRCKAAPPASAPPLPSSPIAPLPSRRPHNPRQASTPPSWGSVPRRPRQPFGVPTQLTACCAWPPPTWRQGRRRGRGGQLAAARLTPCRRVLAGRVSLPPCCLCEAWGTPGAPAGQPCQAALWRPTSRPCPCRLQRRALALLRRLAAWYKERPEVQAEAARAQQAQQEHNSQPLRRRDAERQAAELAAMPGAPLCPCGCGSVSAGPVLEWPQACCARCRNGATSCSQPLVPAHDSGAASAALRPCRLPCPQRPWPWPLRGPLPGHISPLWFRVLPWTSQSLPWWPRVPSRAPNPRMR